MEAHGGAEVRRLHILYLLCRNGRNEHPHLIRIHHLSRDGVWLKDFKRWLGDLRGKDMPESFVWSYKRRYKTGYVWQDLLDDDLVTPISDNEYVLKGSEICSTTNSNAEEFSRIPMQKEQSSLQESAKDSQETSPRELENQVRSSEIEESSATFGSETSSTLTDYSGKHEPGKNPDSLNQEETNSSTSLTMPLLKKEKLRKTKKVNIINENGINTSADKPHFRRSHSSGIFRNLITCGAVDTNNAAVVMTSKRRRPFLNTCSSHKAVNVKNSAEEKSEREQRVSCAAYKPLYGPNCSQCGKRFRPEKLHSHMKSCEGMKAMARGSNHVLSGTENIPTVPRNEDSVSGYFLTR